MAGLGLNARQRQHIYGEMMAFSRFPEDLFIAHEEIKQTLRRSLDQRRPETERKGDGSPFHEKGSRPPFRVGHYFARPL